MSKDSNLLALPIEQYKTYFSGLSDLAQKNIFQHCSRTLIFSRHHYLDFNHTQHERGTLKELLESVINQEMKDENSLELIGCLHLLSLSDIGLEQVPQELTLVNVVNVIRGRLQLYADHGSEESKLLLEEPDLLLVAAALPSIREELDKRYYRYSIIDGERWYRTESLIPHYSVSEFKLTQELIDKISTYSGYKISEEDPLERHLKFVHAAVENSLSTDGESKSVIFAILEHITEDKNLQIDFVTVTCPNGIELHQPEVIGQGKASNDEIFTKTWIRKEIHVEKPEMIEQIVNARMTKLKQKAVKSFYHPGPLFGKVTEKSSDYFISFKEDAHHKGHQMAGVSTAGRSPIFIDVQERDLVLPPSMADLRCIRMSRKPEDQFTESLLKIVIYYANIVKLFIESTYRLNGVIAKIESKRSRRGNYADSE